MAKAILPPIFDVSVYQLFKELAEKHRELNKAKKRIAEIDSLIQKIYEEEQHRLKATVLEMESYLETETDKTESLQKFIDKEKKLPNSRNSRLN